MAKRTQVIIPVGIATTTTSTTTATINPTSPSRIEASHQPRQHQENIPPATENSDRDQQIQRRHSERKRRPSQRALASLETSLRLNGEYTCEEELRKQEKRKKRRAQAKLWAKKIMKEKKRIFYETTARFEKCPICLYKYKYPSGRDIVRTPCEHHFHFKCLFEWFYSESEDLVKSCPICRRSYPFAEANRIFVT